MIDRNGMKRMKGSIMGMKLGRVLLAVVFLNAISGCAALGVPEPRDCAAVGAGIGAAGFGTMGALHADDSAAEGVGIGVGGTVAVAALSYGICKLVMEDESEEVLVRRGSGGPRLTKPVPPPPPAPAPMAAVCSVSDVLDGVTFDTNLAEIRPGAALVLDELARDLDTCRDTRIRIEAHTDSVGSADYNRGLSERRAASVRQYLLERGFPGDRIESQGFGESRPMSSNETREGRAQNRRVEVHPVSEEGAQPPAP